MGELQNRGGLARGHIVDPAQIRVERDVDQGGSYILDKHKIAGLLTIAMDGNGGSSEGGLKKSWDGSSVGTIWILVGSIHIKKT